MLIRRVKPNARGEPRPMAGATQERKLLGVGSTAWFGKECHPPRDADPMVVFL